MRRVFCGPNYSASISETGMLYTWGNGIYGNLGHDGKYVVIIKERILKNFPLWCSFLKKNNVLWQPVEQNIC
jgi:alpha-tubulin suppressor-like RCC1 family protein